MEAIAVEVELTDAERALDDAVRRWAGMVVPGGRLAADAAAAVALDRFASGSSTGEACDAAQLLLGSWLRHPSRPPCRLLHMPTAS